MNKNNFIPIYMLYICLYLLCGCNTSKKQETSQNISIKTDSLEKKEREKILFFGNSLTAGYGLDIEETFSAVLQKKIDSLVLDYVCINAGVSGETSASALTRIDWYLKEHFSIIILETGGNDGLRGITLTETKKNIESIILKIKNKKSGIRSILAGMQIPPNMGEKYTSEFQSLYPQISTQYNIPLIPFLLENVAGIPELNLPDGIHPTAEGQKIVAENVWKKLYPLLQ